MTGASPVGIHNCVSGVPGRIVHQLRGSGGTMASIKVRLSLRSAAITQGV